jgi:hypothetical protein
VTSSYIATAQHAERYLDEEANLVGTLLAKKLRVWGWKQAKIGFEIT